MINMTNDQTKKLYYDDQTLTRFTARVLVCEPEKNGWQVLLDATAFYPEGGGQPADHGVLSAADAAGRDALSAGAASGPLPAARVLDVHEKGGLIWHLTDAPLPAGETVTGEVDAVRRLEMSQQHTGEHILSGLLHEMFGAENVGFHIGEEIVTLDTSLPIPPEGLAEAERRANAVIWADTPVRAFWPAPEELAQLEYRSKKALEGPVRILEIPGADRCACCGTHVAHAGQVGMIKIIAAQNYKRGTRITIACGLRALADYRAKCTEQTGISVLLSAKPGRLAEAVGRLAAENDALKARLAESENRLFAKLAAEVTPGSAPLLLCEGLAPDGLRRLCSALCEKTSRPCAAFSPAESGGFGYALGWMGSDENGRPADIRPLGKALNAAFAGRGGGKPGLVQGSVAAPGFAEIEAFWKENTAQ